MPEAHKKSEPKIELETSSFPVHYSIFNIQRRIKNNEYRTRNFEISNLILFFFLWQSSIADQSILVNLPKEDSDYVGDSFSSFLKVPERKPRLSSGASHRVFWWSLIFKDFKTSGDLPSVGQPGSDCVFVQTSYELSYKIVISL